MYDFFRPDYAVVYFIRSADVQHADYGFSEGVRRCAFAIRLMAGEFKEGRCQQLNQRKTIN